MFKSNFSTPKQLVNAKVAKKQNEQRKNAQKKAQDEKN